LKHLNTAAAPRCLACRWCIGVRSAKCGRPGEKIQPAIGWIACGERAYGILYASGGIAVGGIASGA
jgi:hypothetical protein